MGFDALFLLIQTLLVFILGGSIYISLLGPAKFLVETAIMMVAAMGLFSVLLGRGRADIHRMILTGVIFGVLFRSLTSFLQRVLDPSEFSVVQGAMFASFNAVDGAQLAMASAVCLACFAFLKPICAALDVVALGRKSAIGLGLPYDKMVLGLLALVAALVSVSTALVGPITFLGLLVAALAHSLMKTHRHVLLLPAAAMISALILVSGQVLFERILQLQSTLSVIVEFVGGMLFLYLVLRGRVR
jgi:iron complex transport system permease protein